MLALVAALVLASTGTPNHATTPEAAALAAVYALKKPIRVLRTNIVGPYATVLLQNAGMEGTPENVPILVERFSFGWQAIESLDFECRLTQRGFDAETEKRLMRGMPKPSSEWTCGQRWQIEKDGGPLHEVLAFRQRATEPLVPSVRVAGDYAVVNWYGAGGGQALYHRADGKWTLLQGGGGAIGEEDMRRLHVPASVWCGLGIYCEH